MKWHWGSLDSGRLKRAASVKLVSFDKTNQCGVFKGSGNREYQTTLYSCNCPDFAINKREQACKHIIRLGIECGIIEETGLLPEDQMVVDYIRLMYDIALNYGLYYAFDQPMISDKEYDEMKRKYLALKEQVDIPAVQTLTPGEFAEYVGE